MKIKSKTSNVTWNVKVNNKSLSKEDISFIEKFNPVIYHNDADCNLWVFDTKLPSGRWLENIKFNNEITEAKGLIL